MSKDFDPPLPDSFIKEILRAEVGSGLHGTGLPGVEDRDEMGVAIDTLDHVLSSPKQHGETWWYRTAPGETPSGPDDLDLCVHPLRKYLALALGGNPSILVAMYAPDDFMVRFTEEGAELVHLAFDGAFVSRIAAKKFLGYMTAQRERLLGIRRGRGPKESRPEVSEHGYDTKYAMHALRLGFQGVEFLNTGIISEPMKGDQRDICLEVRRGKYLLSEVTSIIEDQEHRLRSLWCDESIPAQPERERVMNWAKEVYLRHWGMAV